MGFRLFEEVRVAKNVRFPNRKITIKKGETGVIIDISKSLDGKRLGYTLELPQYSNFDPTFIFEEDELEKIDK